MGLATMNHLDFLTFQLNVFSSLSPRVALEENLRAVMAPALAKICRHCGAEAVFHVFENVAMKEMHALAVGKQAIASDALRCELKRRSSGAGSLTPGKELPKYRRCEHNVNTDVFSQEKREYAKRISKTELNVLKAIGGNGGSDGAPGGGDWIIVVPLATKEFARLGAVVAWAPGDTLESTFNNPTVREGLVLFRLYVQRLLTSLFSNYYNMGQETYLPSYQCPGVKAVTLLCAQIRGFERLCQIVQQRGDSTAEEKSKCLRSLVSGFTETTADIVEAIGGRIDQLWGSGLVAVFGEYLHTPQIGPFAGDALARSRLRHLAR